MGPQPVVFETSRRIMKLALLALSALLLLAVDAYPVADNAAAAFLGGLALGAVKGQFLAQNSRPNRRNRPRFGNPGIPKAKVALGVGVVKGLALASLLNNG